MREIERERERERQKACYRGLHDMTWHESGYIKVNQRIYRICPKANQKLIVHILRL